MISKTAATKVPPSPPKETDNPNLFSRSLSPIRPPSFKPNNNVLDGQGETVVDYLRSLLKENGEETEVPEENQRQQGRVGRPVRMYSTVTDRNLNELSEKDKVDNDNHTNNERTQNHSTLPKPTRSRPTPPSLSFSVTSSSPSSSTSASPSTFQTPTIPLRVPSYIPVSQSTPAPQAIISPRSTMEPSAITNGVTINPNEIPLKNSRPITPLRNPSSQGGSSPSMNVPIPSPKINPLSVQRPNFKSYSYSTTQYNEIMNNNNNNNQHPNSHHHHHLSHSPIQEKEKEIVSPRSQPPIPPRPPSRTPSSDASAPRAVSVSEPQVESISVVAVQKPKSTNELILDRFRQGAHQCLTHPTDDKSNKHTINLKDSYLFREYSPQTFKKLRIDSEVPNELYLEEMCVSSLSELGYSGKSGSLLYKTASGNFILKTISKHESRLLRSLLHSYAEHLGKNPNSLLVRFLGLYRIYGGSTSDDLYLVSMKNAFQTKNKINERYDLKGSSVGRQTLFSCEEVGKPVRLSCVILKDKDLHARTRIQLAPSSKQSFLSILFVDANFLEKHEIIDYSLLLGVHYIDPQKLDDLPVVDKNKPETLQTEDGGFYSLDKQYHHLGFIYYMTIIDILQPYNIIKQVERSVKSLRYDKGELSVAPPSDYMERFFRFIANHID